MDLSNPEYWRFRAEEARSIAESLEHEEPKKIMQRIAADYERIAQFASKNSDRPQQK